MSTQYRFELRQSTMRGKHVSYDCFRGDKWIGIVSVHPCSLFDFDPCGDIDVAAVKKQFFRFKKWSDQ